MSSNRSKSHSHGDSIHKCFDCQKQIESNEPHIHVGINELERMGMNAPPIPGMDDLKFAFCEPCTIPSERGWQFESHAVKGK